MTGVFPTPVPLLAPWKSTPLTIHRELDFLPTFWRAPLNQYDEHFRVVLKAIRQLMESRRRKPKGRSGSGGHPATPWN
jgi:hypothetical protein